MKILLDENMPAKVKYDVGEGHEVKEVRDMGWLGKKNGELLGLAAINGFDIFITLDKNLKNQQNLNKVDLKFIVLLAKDNKHETLHRTCAVGEEQSSRQGHFSPSPSQNRA